METTVARSNDFQHWPKSLRPDVFKTKPSTSSDRNLNAVEKIQLHDIRRQGTSQTLISCIEDGLKGEEKELPSLLLWNDRGLTLFDYVLESPDYYPATREWSLLRGAIHKLADSISSGDRLIELGAGNMKKTGHILQTLQSQQKKVQYIACDVDRAALRRCIRELQAMFPASTSSIRISGLLGTYEDCAAWLKCNSTSVETTIMWLGNSLANFTPQEASGYIRSFLDSGSSMIIGLDGSQDQKEIAASYEGSSNRAFILNGLPHANELLGTAAFDPQDWEFAGRWNSEIWMHEAFYVARRDVDVVVCGETYAFRKGQALRSIRSGKWPREKVVSICAQADGSVEEAWMNGEESYGIYLVKRD